MTRRTPHPPHPLLPADAESRAHTHRQRWALLRTPFMCVLRDQHIRCQWLDLSPPASSASWVRHNINHNATDDGWAGAGVLRVTLIRPRRPAILRIHAMDELLIVAHRDGSASSLGGSGGYETGTTIRARLFMPSRGRLVRGGLVLVD